MSELNPVITLKFTTPCAAEVIGRNPSVTARAQLISSPHQLLPKCNWDCRAAICAG